MQDEPGVAAGFSRKMSPEEGSACRDLIISMEDGARLCVEEIRRYEQGKK
jgi:hypothetical protein